MLFYHERIMPKERARRNEGVRERERESESGLSKARFRYALLELQVYTGIACNTS